MTRLINLQYTFVSTPVPDFIYDSLHEFVRNSNSYHVQPPELLTKLATKYKVVEDSIFLTAGTDQSIFACAGAFGAQTYIFTPTYLGFEEGVAVNGTLHTINAFQGETYSIPTSTIEDATLIFLANPNNPCGVTARTKILELVENNQHAMVVVDETWGEFINDSVIDQVKRHKNLIVLRSFSKTFGLAGIRLGYLFAQPDVIEKLKIQIPWFNTSYLSVGAGIVALEHEDYFKQLRKGILQEKERWVSMLKAAQLHVVPNDINAVLLKFDNEQQALELVKGFAKYNILVNHGDAYSNIGLDKTFVRVTVSTPEHREVVKRVLTSIKS